MKMLAGNHSRTLALAACALLVAPLLHSAILELDDIRPYGNIGTPVAFPPNLAGSGGTLFSTRFEPNQYTGDVVARGIDSTGGSTQDELDAEGFVVTDNALWRAHELLQGQDHANRKIFTSNTAAGSTTGYPFQWDALPAVLKTELDFAGEILSHGSNLVNWIRGDSTNEGPDSGDFRERTALDHLGAPVHYVLGDIPHSSLQYVGPPYKFIDDTAYTEFRTAESGREHVLYVGANDGMLHAFRASDGAELFAYVPQAVLANLGYLSSENYKQSYFVDSTPTIDDAFAGFPGCSAGASCWRTVLVSGLGGGGPSIFALDVTDPGPISDTAAANMILWEFTDPDLGFTFSRPAIAKLSDGIWVAIFGNGVHDTGTSKAALYIVNIDDGSLIQKLEVTPLSTTLPNGIFSPTTVDADFDGDVDYVYAGDTEGNLWKFDFSAMTGVTGGGVEPAVVAFNALGVDYPLARVTGVDGGGNTTTLAIQTRPVISTLADGTTIVIFGTGRIFGSNDAATDFGDSLYGILDNVDYSVPSVGHGVYFPPTAATASDFTLDTYSREWTPGSGVRTLLSDALDSTSSVSVGWRIRLDAGERIIADITLGNKRINFTSVNPVVTNNDNWLNGVDYATGGTPSEQFLDIDGDGDIDGDDLQNGEIPISVFIGHGVASGPRTAAINNNLNVNLVTIGLVRGEIDNPSGDPGISGGHFDLDTFDREAVVGSGDNKVCYVKEGGNGGTRTKACHTHEYDVDWDVNGVNMRFGGGDTEWLALSRPPKPDVEYAAGILSARHRSILEAMLAEEANPDFYDDDTSTEVFIRIMNPYSFDTPALAAARAAQGIDDDEVAAPATFYFQCVDPDSTPPTDSGRIVGSAPDFNALPQADRTCKVGNLTELRIKYSDINSLRATEPRCVKESVSVDSGIVFGDPNVGVNTDYRNGAITVQLVRTSDNVVIYESSNYEHLSVDTLITGNIIGDQHNVGCNLLNEHLRAYKDPEKFGGGDTGDGDGGGNTGPGESESITTGGQGTSETVITGTEIASKRVSWREVIRN